MSTRLNFHFPPLVDYPFDGPFLDGTWDPMRCEAVERLVSQLSNTLGASHADTAIARSWQAVLHGSECFDEGLLQTLRDTEPVIREHFPLARRALALNLAAQGCHTWFLHSHAEALPALQEAFDMMHREPLVCAADLIKTAEVLAYCLTDVGRLNDALWVLAAAWPHFLSAREQSEYLAGQYDEFREEFIDNYGLKCSPELRAAVNAIRGPRILRGHSLCSLCPSN